MDLSNNKILITGGASGIGLGLTKRFLEEGNTIIVCGRRQDVLDKLATEYPGVITRQCDLSDEADRKALYEWVAAEHIDLTVLCNNAGIQQWMDVSDPDFYERAEAEIITNVLAPIHLTNLFINLPSLKTIMNVTSGLAFVPLAKVAVYSATKAFFRSFTLSLRRMLRDRHIEVVEVIPPALNTDLGGKGIHDAAPPVSDFIESIFAQLKEGKDEVTFGMSADRANANNGVVKDLFGKMNS